MLQAYLDNEDCGDLLERYEDPFHKPDRETENAGCLRRVHPPSGDERVKDLGYSTGDARSQVGTAIGGGARCWSPKLRSGMRDWWRGRQRS